MAAHPVSSPPPQPSASRLETAAYVAPFAVYVACMAAQQWLPGSPFGWLILRSLLVLAALVLLSRRCLRLRPGRPAWSALVGVGVFIVWVAPDLLWPGYRAHWLFQNSLTGATGAALPADLRASSAYLLLRIASSALLVPVLEELFWRGWMMRWLIRSNFVSVPLGTYTAASFWITALLFAAEHANYWDVGLAAGVAYNWWMLRSRNLADLMLAHAVTNGCLAAYVVLYGQWQYWP
jgi:CAAX prenyl protease-like protein